ncbi:MAG: chemotaxis protein CheB [Nitrospira sp.]
MPQSLRNRRHQPIKKAGVCPAGIAQDEASSVVFGMPKEAIKVGAVDKILPLDDIAGALVSLVSR